jgi:hypothetical protein
MSRKHTTIRYPEATLQKIDANRGKLNRTAFICKLVDEHDDRTKAEKAALADKTIHDLKCWPRDFEAIAKGQKTHEARIDDRGYAVDHVLRLHEWMPDNPAECDWTKSGGDRIRGTYTGRKLDVTITHITREEYGLPAKLAVMSIKRESAA